MSPKRLPASSKQLLTACDRPAQQITTPNHKSEALIYLLEGNIVEV
jgi:hypothetical protein